MSEDSLLERLTAKTLTAYPAAEGIAQETLPRDRAGEFYGEATRGGCADR